MKVGLKLWSVNTDAYLREAKRLYAGRVFDYLELYVVPGTLETLPLWKALHDDLGLAFVIHAPHSAHGVNLADAAWSDSAARAFGEVRRFADRLGAERVIVHGGFVPGSGLLASGSGPSARSPDPGALARAAETLVSRLQAIGDPRLLLENKPFLPIDGRPARLVGSTPDEIRRVLSAAGCGFCLDVGHAVASANAHAADWRAWLDDFLSLRPAMFHLSDLRADSQVDQHLHFGAGTLPLAEIVSRLPPGACVSVETARDSETRLDDFSIDVRRLRRLFGESVSGQEVANDAKGGKMKERVARVLSEIFGMEIAPDSGFSREENPEWDSMKHIEVVVTLEEEFGASIPPSDIGKLSSIDKIADELSRILGT